VYGEFYSKVNKGDWIEWNAGTDWDENGYRLRQPENYVGVLNTGR
jgi:hypothetical protein